MENVFDSLEEQYTEWYLQELKDAGIVNNFFFHHAKFDLVKGTHYEMVTVGKKRNSSRIMTLAQPHTYTPDFMIVWNCNNGDTMRFIKVLTNISEASRLSAYKSEQRRFFWAQPKPVKYSSIIDVKPMFTRQQSRVAVFSLKRAIMLDKFGLNVQAVIPDILFMKTFTPKRFLRCDRSNKARKINFHVRSLEEFLNVK